MRKAPSVGRGRLSWRGLQCVEACFPSSFSCLHSIAVLPSLALRHRHGCFVSSQPVTASVTEGARGFRVMAAAASMASLSSTSCLPQPQRLCATSVRHQISSRVALGYRASSQSLVNSSFNGVRLQVHTQTGVRNQNLGVSIIRAAGAKGDYLVKKVSARELDDILANERDLPIVVDFYATWCGPCTLLAQELEQLAVEYTDNVRFLKIDTDEEHELCTQMQIRGLPTMVFVSPDADKLAIRTEGLLSTNVIRDIIEKELEASQWDPEWHPDDSEKEEIPQWDPEPESR